jgi:hypothetical protein
LSSIVSTDSGIAPAFDSFDSDYGTSDNDLRLPEDTAREPSFNLMVEVDASVDASWQHPGAGSTPQSAIARSPPFAKEQKRGFGVKIGAKNERNRMPDASHQAPTPTASVLAFGVVDAFGVADGAHTIDMNEDDSGMNESNSEMNKDTNENELDVDKEDSDVDEEDSEVDGFYTASFTEAVAVHTRSMAMGTSSVDAGTHSADAGACSVDAGARSGVAGGRCPSQRAQRVFVKKHPAMISA